MAGSVGTPWVPPERTHPFLIAIYLVGPASVLLVFAAAWGIMVSAIGTTATVALVGLLLAMDAATGLFFTVLWRPSGVRWTQDGVEVRRLFGSVVRIPTDRVQLISRPPVGFGMVSDTGLPTPGVLLSPDQYRALQANRPLAAPG